MRYDNAPAIALYEKWGFHQFGEHAHYYSDGAAALRYEKSLVSRVPSDRVMEHGRDERARPLRVSSGAGKVTRKGKP